MSILIILILWTWGLTPLWVNIIGSILMFFRITAKVIKWYIEIVRLDNKWTQENLVPNKNIESQKCSMEK